MAISIGFRNKIVGFIIVASTILIFLPVLLSKDMIKQDQSDNNAVAISQNGAVRDANGNLVPQSQPNMQQAFSGVSNGGSLTLGGQNTQRGPQPALNPNLNANASHDNSVEMVDFARPNNAGSTNLAGNNQLSSPPQALGPAPLPTAKQPEILTSKPKAPAQKQPEILTAKPKPAPSKVAATASNSKTESKAPASSSNGTKVIAGSRPSERFVIQVGVFAKRANADNVVNKIKNAGISVYAIEVTSNNKVLYRVYAGKANSRSALTSQLSQIDKLCGTKGKIVSL